MGSLPWPPGPGFVSIWHVSLEDHTLEVYRAEKFGWMISVLQKFIVVV
jgi:hypothetical protein